MKKSAIIFVIIVFFAPVLASEQSYLFSFGGGFGLATRNSGSPPWFTLGPEIHLKADAPIKKNWRLEFGYIGYQINDDANASSEFQLGSEESSRTRTLKGYDLSLIFIYSWKPLGDKLGFIGGLGAGLSKWRMTDPGSGITLITSTEHGGATDFEASEIFLAGAAGLEYRFRDNWKVSLDINSHYLTGAGLEFDNTVEDSLGRWNMRAGLSVSYLFGGKSKKRRWDEIGHRMRYTPAKATAEETVSVPIAEIASTTPKSNDTDFDGIPNDEDDCPNTPTNAAGLIDIRGCPIDSDADGYPDYLDACPHNARGALVDANGCPLDSDNDGVPDGIDDCPDSKAGIKVDRFGCVDLGLLQSPTVLNIRYRVNSFEIDPYSMQKLDSIAAVLAQAPTVMVKIIGYTDKEGTSEENKRLSVKRANRVRDYFVSHGIDSNRLSTAGYGENDFIASNDTEVGRQKNRRVELIFSR